MGPGGYDIYEKSDLMIIYNIDEVAIFLHGDDELTLDQHEHRYIF